MTIIIVDIKLHDFPATSQNGKIEFTINNVHAVVYAVQVFTKNECKYQNYLTFSLYLYNFYTNTQVSSRFHSFARN